MSALATVATVATAATVTTFEAYSVPSGKGVSQTEKVKQAESNGAHMGALLAAGKHRKAIIDSLSRDGVNHTIHYLSSGNIRPAYAAVVAVLGKAQSVMLEDGKAPYSEWVRLGAVLGTMPQETKSGKPTAAAKALALHVQYSEGARVLREERAARKAAQVTAIAATE